MYEWLGVGIVLVIAEVLTTNMVFASFAIGAGSAALAATSTDSLMAQLLIFSVMSVLSLTAVRPAVIKHLYRNSGTHISGLNRLIGQSAITSTQIETSAGEILINGDTWSARTKGLPIPAQTQVIVVSINGAIAIVEPQSKD